MQKKLPWIDALRGIAIILVIAVHSLDRLNRPVSHLFFRVFLTGQMGVQLFFVVSAMTLCMSAFSRREEAYPLVNFYSRRFFRIAPAYWISIFLYMAVSHGAQYTPTNILANVLFLHGFYPPANNNIVPGGWSIGTEMAFYAIFPFLWMVQSKIRLPRLWILPVVSVILTAVILWIIRLRTGDVVENNNFLYFNIVTQLNVFVTGICAYRLLGRVPRRTAVLVSLSFAAAGAVLWQLDFGYAFYLVSFAFGIAFAGLALYFSQIRENRLIEWLAPVGKVSFSMYLLHFWVLDMIMTGFNRVSLPSRIGYIPCLLLLWGVTIGIAFVAASLSYRLVEEPGIAFGKRLTRRLLQRLPKKAVGGEY